MHADEAARLRQRRGELGDRDRRGVGGDDAGRRRDRFDLLQDLLLEGEIFGGRLDDQVGVAECGVIDCGGDAGQRGITILGRDDAAVDLAFHVAGHGGHGLVQHRFLGVEQHDWEAGKGANMGDTVAHLARADDADRGDSRFAR